MTTVLIILLSVSVFMILFGHFILSMIDKHWVYPKRLGKIQPPIPQYSPRSTPPEVFPPAFVAMLFRLEHSEESQKDKQSTRFTVTLLDLIHRGKIGVIRDGKKLYLIPHDDESDLLPFEITLLRFIRDAYRDAERLSVAKLKGYIEEHRDCAAEMRSRFLREMVDEFHSRGYYAELNHQASTAHPLVLIGVISVAASLGAILGWLCHHIPLGVIALCLSGFAVWLAVQVFSYDLTHLTEEGAVALGEWKAYGQYIQFLKSGPNDHCPISEWSNVAVYAAAMEQHKTFRELVQIWQDLPDYSLECELYDPYFYKKLSEIDYAILISNAEGIDPEVFKPRL